MSEQDVIELERRYWALRSAVPKFDLNLFTTIVSPPIPSTLCSGEPTVFEKFLRVKIFVFLNLWIVCFVIYFLMNSQCADYRVNKLEPIFCKLCE